MEMEKGVVRWVVNISKWNPTPHYFSYIMSFLPHHEQTSITRFVKMEDRKRAFVSRLLQYALIHQVFRIPFTRIVINRTFEGKPYFVEYDEEKMKLPNFNFNVSHHGDYVAIASEPLCLVGLDIVSHNVPVNEKIEDFIQNFSSYFSHQEWYNIMNAGSSGQMLKDFYRYWCLKEAFVKAIGTGVGCKLDNVEFHHTMWQDFSVKVDGQELEDWRFWLLELDENHTVALARGHPRMATINYKKMLKQIEFNKDEYHLSLQLPDVSFVFRTVEDLLPCSHGLGTV